MASPAGVSPSELLVISDPSGPTRPDPADQDLRSRPGPRGGFRDRHEKAVGGAATVVVGCDDEDFDRFHGPGRERDVTFERWKRLDFA